MKNDYPICPKNQPSLRPLGMGAPMKRDNRYGAFLILSLIFLGVFFFNQSRLTPQPSHKEDASSALTASSARGEGVISHQSEKIGTVFIGYAGFPGFPIDINRATADELTVIPGIGKKTAARIIEKRLEIGGFKGINDLTEVQMVGRVKLERIRKYITVGAVVAVGG